jgi:hypothetical protein
MGQVDRGRSGAYSPDYYLNVVADAMNYLGHIDICPNARPYVVLMFSVATLSGLIAQLETVAYHAKQYGVDCELEAESLSQAKELLNKSLELIRDRKATLDVAVAITNQVGKLISSLAFESSICLAMAGVAVAQMASQKDATG